MTTIVGLIADTHGLVRPQIAAAFSGVDRIIHAGDVGGRAVIDALSRIAPVEAVYGNVDDPADPALSSDRVVSIGGLVMHVSHGHELGKPTAELALKRYAGDVVVFGHTHRAVVVWQDGPAPGGQRRVAVNPGAAGPRRFDVRPSVARLTIVDGRAEIEIISLA